ncbi:MAG: biotin--[acetyl-CoA-carboxylase] ligase [Fuerstiella sp.]
MSTFDLAQISRATGLRHVEYHETLDSTSRLASELLPELLSQSPALVLTGDQTAGRGRGANSWWAMPGALTFTLVLDVAALNLPPERLPLVSLATGTAVREVLAELLPMRTAAIKWPNDVMVGEQKVCGILAEQRSTAGRRGLLIGIGINVNNSLSSAPTEVRGRATSLFDLTGHLFDLTDVLVRIITAMESTVDGLSTDPSRVLRDMNVHNILNGRDVVLGVGDTRLHGTCIGISDTGALQLQTSQGPQTLVAGTILDW